MRDFLALDARDFAAVNGAASRFPAPPPRSALTSARTAGRARRNRAAAGEATTVIVVLVAWALITGYLFAHVAEGALVAAREAPAVSAAIAAAQAWCGVPLLTGPVT